MTGAHRQFSVIPVVAPESSGVFRFHLIHLKIHRDAEIRNEHQIRLIFGPKRIPNAVWLQWYCPIIGITTPRVHPLEQLDTPIEDELRKGRILRIRIETVRVDQSDQPPMGECPVLGIQEALRPIAGVPVDEPI